MFALACRRALPALALAAGLAACSGGAGSAGSPLPSAAAQANIPRQIPAVGIRSLGLDARIVPATKSNLIFAAAETQEDVDGWPNPNKSNSVPTCAIGAPYEDLEVEYGFGVDPYGYLVVPTYNDGAPFVSVWKPNCGARVWQANLPSNSGPADAYSNNAATGLVAVALLSPAGVVLCSQSSGCGTESTYAGLSEAISVAMADDGDCWLDANTHTSEFVLVYFHKCTGSGQLATGTMNQLTGGLFIDTHGNLGSIDTDGVLYVYSGCKPACSLVSQSTLIGDPELGGLDAKGENLVVGDINDWPKIDVYSYSPTSGATYSYSFNNEVGYSWAAHFSPRNKKT